MPGIQAKEIEAREGDFSLTEAAGTTDIADFTNQQHLGYEHPFTRWVNCSAIAYHRRKPL
jgi:hypothetical protein